MPWDARYFLADFYSLNYSAGDAVTANLVEFERSSWWCVVDRYVGVGHCLCRDFCYT